MELKKRIEHLSNMTKQGYVKAVLVGIGVIWGISLIDWTSPEKKRDLLRKTIGLWSAAYMDAINKMSNGEIASVHNWYAHYVQENRPVPVWVSARVNEIAKKYNVPELQSPKL